jgi:hypothetical protein
VLAESPDLQLIAGRQTHGDHLRRTLYVLAFALLVAVLAALAVPVRRFLAQDRCLDSGGRWDTETQTCEHALH